MVGGSLRVFLLLPPHKLVAMILLKVALNTTINFMGYLWNTKKKSYFISKRSLKGDKIPKYRILEGMFNTLDLILLLIFGV
jgi:hypothetical protein